jgi:hypothetical protein
VSEEGCSTSQNHFFLAKIPFFGNNEALAKQRDTLRKVQDGDAAI